MDMMASFFRVYEVISHGVFTKLRMCTGNIDSMGIIATGLIRVS